MKIIPYSFDNIRFIVLYRVPIDVNIRRQCVYLINQKIYQVYLTESKFYAEYEAKNGLLIAMYPCLLFTGP